MRPLLLMVSAVLFIISCQAQSQIKDSLYKKLELAKEDTIKVKLLLEYADIIENSEPAEAVIQAKAAELLSLKLSYKDGLYRSWANIAQGFLIQGLFDSSITYLNKALLYAQQMKDKIRIGTAQLNLCTAYREKGEYEKAMMYCIEGRNLVDDTKDDLLKAKMDDVLQGLYNSRTDYNQGIIHGEKALVVARKSKDQVFLLQCLVNLSVNFMAVKRYVEAEELLQEALKLSKETGNKRTEAVVLMNLGQMAVDNRDAGALKNYSRQSLKLSKEIGSLDREAVIYRAMGIAFLLEANIDSAFWYARRAYEMDSVHKFRSETLEVLNLLAGICFTAGKIEEGFTYSQRFSDTLKIMVNEIISTQTAELQEKYGAEKKQNQITQLESQALVQQFSIRQKSTLNYILAGSAIAILLIAVQSYRTYKGRQKLQQQKITKLETEKQLTATEAVLKGEEQERTRLAQDLHDGLGGMLSGIKFSFNTMKGNLILTPENSQAFERSMDMLDSSIKEMRRVAHNMMPEALVKFGLDTALKDFCNDINQSGALQVNYQSIGMENVAIPQSTAITLYRIVQELMNNTLKHASAKTAIVQLTKRDGHLALTVEDDGKGFDASILKQAKGIGWTNIQNRVEFLQGSLDVQSRNEKGTSVHIEVNI